ncbi:DNA ligase 4 [Bienertia sinuspersici]
MTSIANLQHLNLHCRGFSSFTAPTLTFVSPFHHSLFKGCLFNCVIVGANSQTWGKKDTALSNIWCNNKLLPNRYLLQDAVVVPALMIPWKSLLLKLRQAPFGYTRKDVLLIGLGVTIFGVALKSGLEFIGVDPLQAGNVVQLLVVLGMTIGWISTYMFRVASKDMTYAQQLRDYENKVMEKRIEGLTEAELQVLLEQVEEEKRQVANGEKVK